MRQRHLRSPIGTCSSAQRCRRASWPGSSPGRVGKGETWLQGGSCRASCLRPRWLGPLTGLAASGRALDTRSWSLHRLTWSCAGPGSRSSGWPGGEVERISVVLSDPLPEWSRARNEWFHVIPHPELAVMPPAAFVGGFYDMLVSPSRSRAAAARVRRAAHARGIPRRRASAPTVLSDDLWRIANRSSALSPPSYSASTRPE